MIEGAVDLPPVHHTHPAAVSPEVEQRILAMSLEHPAWGCDRLSGEQDAFIEKHNKAFHYEPPHQGSRHLGKRPIVRLEQGVQVRSQPHFFAGSG